MKTREGLVLFLTTGIMMMMVMVVNSAPVTSGVTEDFTQERDCHYYGKPYPHGDSIEMEDPCLNCTCTKGVLVCFLRVCPNRVLPPDSGCTLTKTKGRCCAEVSCGNKEVVSSSSSSTTVVSTHFGRQESDVTDISTTSSSSSVDITNFTDDDDNDVTPTPTDFLVHDDAINLGCRLNGSVYAEGSAMLSSSFCEYCYCIRGQQRCIRPQCHLNIDDCGPLYHSGFSCCPSAYQCNRNKSSSRFTTVAPQSRGDCVENGTRYREGEPVLRSDACSHCFCVHGIVKCSTVSCPLDMPGCEPIIQPGKCCPTGYNCSLSGTSSSTVASEERNWNVSLSTSTDTSTVDSTSADGSGTESVGNVTTNGVDTLEPTVSSAASIRNNDRIILDELGNVTEVDFLDSVSNASTTVATDDDASDSENVVVEDRHGFDGLPASSQNVSHDSAPSSDSRLTNSTQTEDQSVATDVTATVPSQEEVLEGRNSSLLEELTASRDNSTLPVSEDIPEENVASRVTNNTLEEPESVTSSSVPPEVDYNDQVFNDSQPEDSGNEGRVVPPAYNGTFEDAHGNAVVPLSWTNAAALVQDHSETVLNGTGHQVVGGNETVPETNNSTDGSGEIVAETLEAEESASYYVTVSPPDSGANETRFGNDISKQEVDTSIHNSTSVPPTPHHHSGLKDVTSATSLPKNVTTVGHQSSSTEATTTKYKPLVGSISSILSSLLERTSPNSTTDASSISGGHHPTSDVFYVDGSSYFNDTESFEALFDDLVGGESPGEIHFNAITYLTFSQENNSMDATTTTTSGTTVTTEVPVPSNKSHPITTIVPPENVTSTVKLNTSEGTVAAVTVPISLPGATSSTPTVASSTAAMANASFEHSVTTTKSLAPPVAADAVESSTEVTVSHDNNNNDTVSSTDVPEVAKRPEPVYNRSESSEEPVQTALSGESKDVPTTEKLPDTTTANLEEEVTGSTSVDYDEIDLEETLQLILNLSKTYANTGTANKTWRPANSSSGDTTEDVLLKGNIPLEVEAKIAEIVRLAQANLNTTEPSAQKNNNNTVDVSVTNATSFSVEESSVVDEVVVTTSQAPEEFEEYYEYYSYEDPDQATSSTDNDEPPTPQSVTEDFEDKVHPVLANISGGTDKESSPPPGAIVIQETEKKQPEWILGNAESVSSDLPPASAPSGDNHPWIPLGVTDDANKTVHQNVDGHDDRVQSEQEVVPTEEVAAEESSHLLTEEGDNSYFSHAEVAVPDEEKSYFGTDDLHSGSASRKEETEEEQDTKEHKNVPQEVADGEYLPKDVEGQETVVTESGNKHAEVHGSYGDYEVVVEAKTPRSDLEHAESAIGDTEHVQEATDDRIDYVESPDAHHGDTGDYESYVDDKGHEEHTEDFGTDHHVLVEEVHIEDVRTVKPTSHTMSSDLGNHLVESLTTLPEAELSSTTVGDGAATTEAGSGITKDYTVESTASFPTTTTSATGKVVEFVSPEASASPVPEDLIVSPTSGTLEAVTVESLNPTSSGQPSVVTEYWTEQPDGEHGLPHSVDGVATTFVGLVKKGSVIFDDLLPLSRRGRPNTEEKNGFALPTPRKSQNEQNSSDEDVSALPDIEVFPFVLEDALPDKHRQDDPVQSTPGTDDVGGTDSSVGQTIDRNESSISIGISSVLQVQDIELTTVDPSVDHKTDDEVFQNASNIHGSADVLISSQTLPPEEILTTHSASARPLSSTAVLEGIATSGMPRNVTEADPGVTTAPSSNSTTPDGLTTSGQDQETSSTDSLKQKANKRIDLPHPMATEGSVGHQVPSFVDIHQHNSAYCVENGELFQDGERIPTLDFCAQCRCNKGTILCQHVSCPQKPPGCVETILQNSCCPAFVCNETDVDTDSGSLPVRTGITIHGGFRPIVPPKDINRHRIPHYPHVLPPGPDIEPRVTTSKPQHDNFHDRHDDDDDMEPPGPNDGNTGHDQPQPALPAGNLDQDTVNADLVEVHDKEEEVVGDTADDAVDIRPDEIPPHKVELTTSPSAHERPDLEKEDTGREERTKMAPATTTTTTFLRTSTRTTTTTTEAVPKSDIDVPSASSGGNLWPIMLRVSGCNIYGRLYQVGSAVGVLSGPCKECKCTSTGVECFRIKCVK